MSRPPVRNTNTATHDRVLVSNARGQQRIIGDPFATTSAAVAAYASSSSSSSSVAARPTGQLNAYGHSVNMAGHTSGALQSRQQQEQMKSQEAAGMLLDALEKYGPAPGAKAMLNWERSAAQHAVAQGVYVSWRSCRRGKEGTDCTRVGPDSLCFCGHGYSAHGGPRQDAWKKNRMSCDSCPCANFSFIPRRPEECGEWWLPRRKGFDAATYKAKCKCGHAHDEHDPNGMHACRVSQPRAIQLAC